MARKVYAFAVLSDTAQLPSKEAMQFTHHCMRVLLATSWFHAAVISTSQVILRFMTYSEPKHNCDLISAPVCPLPLLTPCGENKTSVKGTSFERFETSDTFFISTFKVKVEQIHSEIL